MHGLLDEQPGVRVRQHRVGCGAGPVVLGGGDDEHVGVRCLEGLPDLALALLAREHDGVRRAAQHQAVDERAELHRGGRVVGGPGHAPGHLALSEESRRFLLAGDLVSGVSTILIDPEEGDMAAYLTSLERMAALGPRLVVASHGPPFGPGAQIFEKVLAHRRAREERVLACLREEPQSVEALTEAVYADTPGAHPELARRSLTAHLLKLADEGKAYRSRSCWGKGSGLPQGSAGFQGGPD